MNDYREAAQHIATYLHSAGSVVSTGEYIRLSRRLNDFEINHIAEIIREHCHGKVQTQAS